MPMFCQFGPSCCGNITTTWQVTASHILFSGVKFWSAICQKYVLYFGAMLAGLPNLCQCLAIAIGQIGAMLGQHYNSLPTLIQCNDNVHFCLDRCIRSKILILTFYQESLYDGATFWFTNLVPMSCQHWLDWLITNTCQIAVEVMSTSTRALLPFLLSEERFCQK